MRFSCIPDPVIWSVHKQQQTHLHSRLLTLSLALPFLPVTSGAEPRNPILSRLVLRLGPLCAVPMPLAAVKCPVTPVNIYIASVFRQAL